MFNPNKFYGLSAPTTLRFPRIPRVIYLIIIAVLSITITFASLILGAILEQSLLVNIVGSDSSPFYAMGRLIVQFAPMFPLVYLALKLFEKRGLASVGMQKGNAVRHYFRGLAVGLVLMGAIIIVLWLLGAVTLENPLNAVSIGGAFIVLIGWMVQGAAEEVVFRGFFLQIFGRITNEPFAIFVSSFFFMAIHGGGDDIGIIAKLSLFLIAVLLAVYVQYEGGLWGAFGIHTIYNWAQSNLFGIGFSSADNESAIVFDLVRTGPELLVGGSFGLEGGIVCTAVVCTGLLMLFLFGKRLQPQS